MHKSLRRGDSDAELKRKEHLHFNKLGTPFGTFDYAISTRSTSGTEDVKYGLSKGKWEVEFIGIATAANGDMYSVVDGAKLTFSVTK